MSSKFEGNMMHVRNWSKVCNDQKFEGLGIRRLEVLNRAFLDLGTTIGCVVSC